MLDEIRSRLLAVAGDPALLTNSGLLFHGTVEPFDTQPDAVGMDGLLWFARSPLVAQAYIPDSGLSTYVGKPSPFNMDDRVWPNPGFWTDFAVHDLGYALPDVEYDDLRRAKSWSATMPWPTYRECLSRLAERGYAFETDPETIKLVMNEGRTHVMPKSWRLPGRVYVTLDQGLRFADFSTGESDLTEKAHLRFDRFERARSQGADGVIIDDFCQSEDCGNVAHRAYGLFSPAATKLEYLVYDAVHRPMADAAHLTEDLRQFLASMEPAAHPAP